MDSLNDPNVTSTEPGNKPFHATKAAYEAVQAKKKAATLTLVPNPAEKAGLTTEQIAQIEQSEIDGYLQKAQQLTKAAARAEKWFKENPGWHKKVKVPPWQDPMQAIRD